MVEIIYEEAIAMKQRLVTLVAGLCAAVIVTGCSSTPNETTQQSEVQTGKQTEVSVQAKEQTEVSAQTKEQTESAMQLSTEGQEEQPVTEAMKLMAASTEAEGNTLASETETEAAVLPETEAET
ncbi:MAG TPA: hypothetical protein DHV42_06660, partial [Lachnospiraceae bacterium]|nr:hypothetical protein [Lachnospiraceae bacterium]